MQGPVDFTFHFFPKVVSSCLGRDTVQYSVENLKNVIQEWCRTLSFML